MPSRIIKKGDAMFCSSIFCSTTAKAVVSVASGAVGHPAIAGVLQALECCLSSHDGDSRCERSLGSRGTPAIAGVLQALECCLSSHDGDSLCERSLGRRGTPAIAGVLQALECCLS
jgi:hypothetical protein